MGGKRRAQRGGASAARGKKDLPGLRAELETRQAEPPDNSYIPYALALYAKEEKQHAQAQDAFQKAIHRRPAWPESFVELVDTYRALNDLEAGRAFRPLGKRIRSILKKY